MSQATPGWTTYEEYEDGSLEYRQVHGEGMEAIAPEHVLARHPETNEPVLGFDPSNGRMSWDPRYIDGNLAIKAFKQAFKETTGRPVGKSKGFGY